MKRIFTIAVFAACSLAALAHDTTNTVLYVDQNGRLNAEGVASVENVASNSAKVAVAEQKAEIAQNTAVAVSNSIQAVVQNLMANNEIIYRSGFSDAFAPLVVFTDSDKLAMTDARWTEKSAARLVVEIDYVCTKNMGTTKPTVMHRETLDGQRTNFSELSESNVSTPVYHAEEREFGGQTFAGYYTVSATIPNPSGTTTYFLWIKAEADSPSGDGATLDLPNGVTGGMSCTVTLGDKSLTWVGGVLMEVE